MVLSGIKWSKVGDYMLMGEYHHNIDDKGRLTIPSKIRYELGEKFIATRGLDGCLFIYFSWIGTFILHCLLLGL